MRMEIMRFFPTIGVLMLLLSSCIASLDAAAAQTPLVRVDSSIDSVWVGQKAAFAVVLLSPSFFSGSPKFDLPEIPGVLFMRVPGRPTVGSQTVDGHTYSTQTHEFAVFPLKPGKTTIPPITARFGIASPGGSDPQEHEVRTPEFHFVADMPPGAEKLAMVVGTNDLKVSDKWDPKPGRAKVGDAFVRTVAIRASDIPGMALWPMPRIDVPGLGIYAEKPEIRDSYERGDFTGERVETLTYVCEKEGNFVVPGVSFHWWDTGEEKMKPVELEPVALKVASAPSAETGNAAREKNSAPSHGLAWTVGIVVACILFGVFRKTRSRLKTARKEPKTTRDHAEAAVFSSLVLACRKNDALAAYNELGKWLNRFSESDTTPTIMGFASDAADPAMKEALADLQTNVVFAEENWNGAALAALLSKYRKTSTLSKRKKTGSKNPLPDLNSVQPFA